MLSKRRPLGRRFVYWSTKPAPPRRPTLSASSDEKPRRGGDGHELRGWRKLGGASRPSTVRCFSPTPPLPFSSIHVDSRVSGIVPGQVKTSASHSPAYATSHCARHSTTPTRNTATVFASTRHRRCRLEDAPRGIYFFVIRKVKGRGIRPRPFVFARASSPSPRASHAECQEMRALQLPPT